MNAHDDDKNLGDANARSEAADLAELERSLRTILHDSADDVHLLGAGATTVMRRARRQQNRQRLALAGAAAGVVGLGVWGVSTITDGGQQVAVGDEGGSAGLPVSGSIEPYSIAPVQFTWIAAEPGAIWYPQRAFIGSDGTYYAISTAPGLPVADDAPPADVLYRSADGLHWESVGADDPWLGQLAERDGVLYSLSTGPGTNGVVVQIAQSADGGRSWNGADLTASALPPAGLTLPLTESTVSTRLVAGPEQVVAIATTVFYPDLSSVITAADGPDAWPTWDSAGIHVVAPADDCAGEAIEPAISDAETGREIMAEAAVDCEPQVLRTVGWAEVGISYEELTVRQVFVSADGVAWDPVADPFAGRQVDSLVATPQGFFATTWVETIPGSAHRETLRSDDGRVWAPVITPADGASVIGVTGQRLVAVDGQNLVYTSLDGGATWSVADLSGLLAQQASGGSVWSYGAEVGPLGIGVIIGTDDGAGGFEYALAFSPDGTTWTVTDQAQLEAAAGVEVASIDWILVGEDQVVVNGTVSAERNADGNLPLFVVAGVPST